MVLQARFLGEPLQVARAWTPTYSAPVSQRTWSTPWQARSWKAPVYRSGSKYQAGAVARVILWGWVETRLAIVPSSPSRTAWRRAMNGG